jgi:Ca-activated chloride channel family protein
MSFLHPGWLLLALILPLIILGAVLAYRSRSKAWRQLVAPRLRTQLVREAPQTRRWISLSLGLLGCALIIAAIARPYQGKTTTTERVNTRNILIAVDTSRSMLVKDGSPDRIATAKAMALELTNTFSNDRIGIIAFSGNSLLLAPLTIDHSSVRDTIGQLDTRIIPSGGSNIAAAVKTAFKTFSKIGHRSNALIIISDGENHNKTIDSIAEQISDGKCAISTVGVGSKEGDMIPDALSPDGKFRDIRGNAVYSCMIPDALMQLASAGGGIFTEANSNAPSAIRDSLAFLESNEQESLQISLPNEKYPWFLIPAILCLISSIIVRSNILSSAKHAPIAACLLLVFTPNDIHAATNLERAISAYENKDFATALSSFEAALDQTKGDDRHTIEFSIGSTAYRLKNWPTASLYFSNALLSPNKGLCEAAHYNMGNTLFQSALSMFKTAEKKDQPQAKTQTFQLENLTAAITQLEDAISHYSATIDLNAEHKDAQHNRTEAEKLLKQLKEQQKQDQQKQEGDQPKQGKDDKPKDKGDKPDQKSDGSQQSDNPQQGDPNKPPEKPDDGDGQKPDQGDKPEPPNKPQKQQPGETDEAYAARILKENSDSETRPVKSQFLRVRRTTKDW